VSQELERLLAALDARYPTGSRDEYVRITTLRTLVREAQLPPGQTTGEFPLMMYLGGSRNDFTTVGSAEEKLKAERLGYITTPNPQYASGYPQSWIETPASGRGSDLRRVLLHNADEHEKFRSLTHDGHNWQRDDEQQHGGRGTDMHELILEKEAELQQVMHDQLHSQGLTALAGAVNADADAAAPDMAGSVSASKE
jgi:hypothetical protein